MNNIAIVGAGAMGCLFGARLARSGFEVTLIDVDARKLEALQRFGLTYESGEDTHLLEIAAVEANRCRDPVDAVLMFTKGMHTAAAARSVAHLATPSCWAITLQNGVGNAEAMAEVFAPDRILIGATDYPADLKSPTHVASHGEGTVWLGAFSAAPATAAEAAADLLRKAGFRAVASPRILSIVWEKLAFNAALNATATITGLTVGALDTPPGRRLAFAAADEVIATAAAKGIALDKSSISARIDHAFGHHRDHRASMLQDRLARRPTEIETINGAVVREAERAGLKAPVNAALADLVRLLEGRGGT